MPDTSARGRSWRANALRVARAAAFLTLATGINGTAAAYFPRYEPFYVYLLSVIVVAWLSGILLGVSTAVAAVICYDWMFSPLANTGPAASSVIPLAFALTAVVVTQLAKAPLRRPAIAVTTAPPPLLTAASVVDASVVNDRRVPELQRRITDLEGQLAQAHTSARLRAESLQEASNREGVLNRELEAARNAVSEQNARSTSLRRDIETAKQRNLELDGRVAALQQELEVAWRKVDEEKSRADQIAAQQPKPDVTRYETQIKELTGRVTLTAEQLGKLRRELDDARRIAADERARGDREAGLRAQMETAARQTLQRTADVAASHQRGEQQAREALKAAAAKITILEQDLQRVTETASVVPENSERISELQQSLTAAESRGDLLQQELDRVRALLDQETSRADSETELREQLELAGHEKMQNLFTELSTKYETALAAANGKLQKIDSDRAAEMANLVAERDAARSETAGLWQELNATRRVAEQERQTRETLAEEFDRRLKGIEREREEAVAALESERDHARLELDKLRAIHDNLAAELKNTSDELAARDADFDARLNKVVTGLTEDYEQFIGVSTVEKEEARAENRRLKGAIEKLERQLGEARDENQSLKTAAADLDGKIAELKNTQSELLLEKSDHAETQGELERALADVQRNVRERERQSAELQTLRQEVAAEKAARAKAETEADEKLQKIVANLTEDYEQFMGVSIIEKETARAENRRLSAKVQDLQAKLGEEKVARDKRDLEWSEKLQKIVTNLASDHEVDLGNAMVEKEAAKAEARSLQKRMAALQEKIAQEREHFRLLTDRWQSERDTLLGKHAAIETTTQRGANERPAVVLVVHSDSGVRAMAKHALEQSGYSVLTAADGLEGLRVASSNKPDVVLAEAVMPKMNGRELVQLLKSRRETAAMKIILMSSPNSSDIEKGSDFRADDFLRNPADFNVMRATLASVLTKR